MDHLTARISLFPSNQQLFLKMDGLVLSASVTTHLRKNET